VNSVFVITYDDRIYGSLAYRTVEEVDEVREDAIEVTLWEICKWAYDGNCTPEEGARIRAREEDRFSVRRLALLDP
jgi:hypothetical protein